MAVITGPTLFAKTPGDAIVVHTDLEARASPAPRLNRRVTELTRCRPTTFILAGLAIFAWVVLKLVVYQKYGAFHFGWFGIVMGLVIILVVGAEIWDRNNRRCLQGELVPTRVFITEGKSMLELTLGEGEHRAPNSLAGTMPSTTGISILRRVVVVYDIGGKTYVRHGPLASGELPACVDGGFKVICHQRWPGRAALLTNYDFEAAPGEAE